MSNSAYVPQTGVGETPVIRWSPPATGTPGVYFVTVFRFDAASGSRTTAAALFTTETSATLPPGVLASGSHHALRIRAQLGHEPSAPRRGTSNSGGWADAPSNSISP